MISLLPELSKKKDLQTGALLFQNILTSSDYLINIEMLLYKISVAINCNPLCLNYLLLPK